MEKKIIKGIIDYERTQLFLVFIVTTIIFVSLIYIGIRNIPYTQLSLILIIITYLYVQINYAKMAPFYCLCRMYGFLKKNNELDAEILWWNNSNCFLVKNKIIIIKWKIIYFSYLEIESIQKEKIKSECVTRTGLLGQLVEYTFINFFLKNGKQYKELMFSTEDYFYPYNDIDDITNLLVEKNPKIIIKKPIIHDLMERQGLFGISEDKLIIKIMKASTSIIITIILFAIIWFFLSR